FVTLNDSGDGDTGGNGRLNYPVLDSALLSMGQLMITGWARPGSVIELFLAAADPTGFGEGQRYLVTMTEGSAADLDSSASSYGPGPVNGLAQGQDTTNRFSFSVPGPVGVFDGTLLTATATDASNNTSEFSGVVAAVGMAEMHITKTQTVDSDPWNGVSNPKAIPGATVIYALEVRNAGGGSPDNDSVVVVDALPADLALRVLDYDGGTSGPVQFVDGVPASTLSYTFTSLASTTDDLEFSNDGGASFTYTPTPDANGLDPAVNQIRVTLRGQMSPADLGGAPSFTLRLKAAVN
ncbi:MAG: hypothetical protein OEQ74_01440, partial [Gammaproteobacteria bacterium]|nr:hypothetical protein [Gammaproteobacteria bacterium]